MRPIPTARGLEKNGPQAIGKSRGGWTTKIHLVAADARTALTFALSPGQAHDSPEGRKLLASMGPQDDNVALVMDRAYQGDETRQLALDLGFTPVVPPLKTRTDPWEYDREMYKGRIPDFPVTRSHPPASWPSAANSSICRTYRKTAGEESRRRSPVANRWMRP